MWSMVFQVGSMVAPGFTKSIRNKGIPLIKTIGPLKSVGTVGLTS